MPYFFDGFYLVLMQFEYKKGTHAAHSCPWQVEVKKSRIAGFGLFAVDHLPAGMDIGKYIGDPISNKRGDLLPEKHKGYLITLPGTKKKRQRIITQHDEYRSNFTRYANEASEKEDCNCELVDRGKNVHLITLREIRCGEELTVDYGPKYNRTWLNEN